MYVDAATIAVLDTVGRRQTRSRSAQVLHYVVDGLRRDGALLDDEDTARPRMT